MALRISGDLGDCAVLVSTTPDPGVRRKVAAVTTYGGSRFRAMLMGDPPRRLVTRLLRSTVKPGASVSYLAHYSMNVATERSREQFMAKVTAKMDAF